MNVIAHRGNLYGPSEKENNPDYLKSAISNGFDVECDIWFEDGQWGFGHDSPEYDITSPYFTELTGKVWYHCKNDEALFRMSKYHQELNFFSHDDDDIVLTSHGIPWCHPIYWPYDNEIIELPINGVYVYDSWTFRTFDEMKTTFEWVCTDYAHDLREWTRK